MQPVLSVEKLKLKKTKSPSNYLKNPSFYVIDHAVDGNMKTSTTEITHDTIIQNSLTVTPTNSRKTLTKCSKQNIANTFTVNDSMTRIKDNCGDGEDISAETSNNIPNYLKINEDNLQPRVIFVAQKHVRKPKFQTETSGRKLKKCKLVVIIKNIHYKNQRARNMTTKLKRYCRKSKKSLDNSRQIQKELDSDSISKKVSRTRILKKVLAKENFLAEAEENIHSPDATNYPFDDDLSFISLSSQGTLKQEDSINSVIEITNSKIKPKINTNIINVAVAQINNTPNLKSYSVIAPHREKVDFKESLTSQESAFSQTLMLASESFLNETIKLTSKEIISDSSNSYTNISNVTLIPSKTRLQIPPNTYEIGNSEHTHEVINEINFIPNGSFTNQSQDYESLNDCHISDNKGKAKNTRQFYEACMMSNVNPKTRPCSSSVPDFPNNDNVIIAEDILKTTQHIHKIKNRGDERFKNVKNDFHANIFQKPFHVVNNEDFQKNLNLPNAAQIRNTIVDTSRPPRKCSQDLNDYPASIPELYDKITITLEIAVKKLEQTLSEKIISELKSSLLYEFDKRITSVSKLQEEAASVVVTEDIKAESSTTSKLTLQTTPHTDVQLQCDIVQKEVIDKLMLIFNEESKSCDQSSSSNYTHKLKKPKLVKDYLEILKDSISYQYKDPEVGNGDSVQISIDDTVEEKMPQYECKNIFWTIPATFIRQNMFVIVSVPAFLFVIFVLYSYIMLIIRMWWY